MASPIEDIIEEIEEYIDTCKPAGFTGNNIKVNRDTMQSLLEELRAKTPEEIRRYQKIINNEKAIIDNAKKQANDILAKAQIKTDELISEHQIMQQAYSQANAVVMEATKRAQELLDKATNDANAIRTSAIEYTDDLLSHVQDIMQHSMGTTKGYTDQFLNEMQAYLDMVLANRMELSPSPEEVVVNSPQRERPAPVQQPPEEKEEEKPQQQAEAADAKDDGKDKEKAAPQKADGKKES